MKATIHILAVLAILFAPAGYASAQPRDGSHTIRKCIRQLHAKDYAKRNAAIQSLTLDPATAEAAMPLLKQRLERESDPNRQWWLQTAIQKCEEALPRPGEIFATPERTDGLQVNAACKGGDGPFTTVGHNGVPCWQMPNHTGNSWSYLYFIADNAFRQKADSALDIQLTYLDAGTGDIGLDYDSTDRRAAVNGAYGNSSLTIHRINSGQWRTVLFHIHNARFQGSENGGSDFRFSVHGDPLLVHSVRVWPVGS